MRTPNQAYRRPWTAGRIALLIAFALGLAACTSSPAPEGSGSTASGSTEAGTDTSAAARSSADPMPTSVAPSPDEQWRHSVALNPLAVPAEMRLPADRDGLGGLIGQAADRPATVAAIRTAPDGRRRLVLSTWDGAGWQPHPTDLPGPAGPVQPQTVAIAGSAGVAAAAGWAWDAGSTSPFLLISTDRATWAPVELPESLAGHRLLAVDADGDRVVAAGQDPRGRIGVVTIDGSGDPTVTNLPPAARRGSRTVTDLAVSGQTVLVVIGRDAVRSVDGGRSWADPVPIADGERAQVAGVTAVTGGFLATGADRVDEASTDRHATAWFSRDGLTWSAEPLPEPDGFRKVGDDSRAGSPTGSVGDAFTVVASDSAASPQVFARRATGEWTSLGAPPEEVAGGFGLGGEAVPAGADPAWPVLVGIDGALGLTLGQLAGGAWTTVVAPAGGGPVTTFRSAPSWTEPQVWKADLQRANFEHTEGVGWNRWLALSSVGLAGDTLVTVPPDPPEATNWTVRAYSGPAELAVISDFVPETSKLAIFGWFRPAPDQPWTPTGGFGAERWEQASAADHVGGLWLIAGEHTDQIASSENQLAMIWYSTDGVAWNRAEGDFTVDGHGSRISGFCSAPGGRRAAVGQVTTADDARHAALWVEQDGRWQRSELPTDPGWASSFGSCVDVAGTLVLNGSLGSDTAQWTWTPETGFAEFDQPGGGSAGTREFHSVAAIPGGYVATGRLDTARHTGPVIWLSADGLAWQWLPLPVDRPAAWALTAVVGSDLLVLSSSGTGSQAWRIPDIAAVIGAIPTT